MNCQKNDLENSLQVGQNSLARPVISEKSYIFICRSLSNELHCPTQYWYEKSPLETVKAWLFSSKVVIPPHEKVQVIIPKIPIVD